MSDRTCSEDGCGRPHWARGFCHWHYNFHYERGTLPTTPIAIDPAERFWRHVRRGGPDECWEWTGSRRPDGYGLFRATSRSQDPKVVPYRFAYELMVGPIPDGLQLDHLCHTRDKACLGGKTCPHRRCVNPAHLEPVTRLVNIRRGRRANSLKTHCPQGHPYDEANTRYGKNGWRECRACDREFQRKKKAHQPARLSKSDASAA